MKAKLITLIAASLCLSGTACAASDVVLLGTRTPADSIREIQQCDFARTAEGLDIHARITSSASGVSIACRADLSACNRLSIRVTNPNRLEYLPLTVELREDTSAPGEHGVFLERIYIPADTTMTVTLDLPATLPHPEMRTKFSGMRRDPYYRWGAIDGIDLAKTAELRLYIHRPRERWQWTVHEVKALEGTPNEPYAWMKLDSAAFFPFIDRYGQFAHNDWPGKTHSDADLKAAYDEEQRDLAAHPGPQGRSRFGGWADGPRQQATGHFRIEKIDGRWWLIDPEGYLYWSHGVVRVTPSSAITPLEGREHYFAALPQAGDPDTLFYTTHDELLKPYYTARNIERTYDFSAANIRRKYGDAWREQYAEQAQRRLHSWGLNTIANSSDRAICAMQRTPYTDRIEIQSPALEGSKGIWWKFKDPFHAEFRRAVHRQLTDRKAELDDPWCLGFFVDNEIDWGQAPTLGIWTLESPSAQPAKQEFIQRLKAKYGTIEALNTAWKSSFSSWEQLLASTAKPPKGATADCTDFSQALIEAYFSNVREVFKQVAPQKLYLGCRFARFNPDVLNIAARYCDVLSYNVYKVHLDGFRLPEGIDKPVLIGEFHFGALDRGLFHPGLVKSSDQQQRAERYAGYVASAMRHPQIIGTHWHQFSDQATTGRFDGENFQVGMTDICDRPYPETIAKVREVGYNMYRIRSTSNPETLKLKPYEKIR